MLLATALYRYAKEAQQIQQIFEPKKATTNRRLDNLRKRHNTDDPKALGAVEEKAMEDIDN